LDSEAQLTTFYALLAVFIRTESARVETLVGNRPGHYHAIVTLDRDVEPLERVLLQSLLGSDPIREALAYEKLKAGYDPESSSVLFRSES
jgi:hypothetical protein